MSKLGNLIDLCACSVTITVDSFKDYHQTVSGWYREMLDTDWIKEGDISADILQGMIDSNTVIEIQFYPSTPVGFHVVHHYDIDKALDICIKHFEE